MRRTLTLPLAATCLLLGLAAPTAADATTTHAHRTQVIVLPGATSAEPIAAGRGTTFYAGDIFGGDLYRGDIRRGTAELFVDRPAGTQSYGMDVDLRHHLLYLAGGPGKAYVIDLRTRAQIAEYTFGTAATSLINDVTVTPSGAWFTDSLQPRLYFVPTVFGRPGPPRTLPLTGPAAGAPGVFTINDITATADGATLLVAPETLGKLCRIDPRTGASALVAGVDIPDTDGVELEGRRLWAVQRFHNQVSRWRLNGDLTSGRLEKVITDPAFGVPVTAALFGDRIALVNSHLDTGFPPTSPTYEVVVVDS